MSAAPVLSEERNNMDTKTLPAATLYDHANRAYTMTRFLAEALDTEGADIPLELSDSGREGLKCILDCIGQSVLEVLDKDLMQSIQEAKN